MTAAMPAREPPIRNVQAITHSTLMPINRAAVGFWAVARIALPIGVNFTNNVNAIMAGMVTKITIASFQVNRTRGLERRLLSGMRSGNLTGEVPNQSEPMFMKQKLTPIAVTITVNFGELRSGA